jgi:hypothetical protein
VAKPLKAAPIKWGSAPQTRPPAPQPEPEPEPEPISRSPRPPRRTALWAALAGVVAGGALVGGVVVATRSSGGSGSVATGSQSSTTTATTLGGPADSGTRQLVALMTAAGKLVFHVRYEIKTTQAQAVLELWHSPPSARLNETETGGGRTVESTQITDGTKEVACQRASGKSWTCVQSGVDPNHNPGDVLLGNLDKFLAEAAYVVTDATLDGRPARCFAGTKALPTGAGSAAPAAPPRICTTPAGIPLLIDTGDGAVTATAVDDVVPATTFVPPAQPVGG